MLYNTVEENDEMNSTNTEIYLTGFLYFFVVSTDWTKMFMKYRIEDKASEIFICIHHIYDS